jgi:hypothetical protein
MKKILCGIVVFLATAAWTQTSSGGGQDQSSSSQGQTSSASKGQTSTSKSQTSGTQKKGTATTLTGCLTGPNDEGVYVLKTKSSKHEIEVGGSDELSKHVNNEVKLHGSWAKSGSDIGEKEGAEKSEKGEANEKHFKVTSIDHIADTCPAASSASKSGSSSKSNGHKGANKPSPSPSPGQ